MLSITDYKPYKRAVRGRVGVRADFRVKPVPKEGVVYQKVTSRYTLGGRTRTYQFTEAWRVGMLASGGGRQAESSRTVQTRSWWTRVT
jgi:hypothetical protein